MSRSFAAFGNRHRNGIKNQSISLRNYFPPIVAYFWLGLRRSFLLLLLLNLLNSCTTISRHRFIISLVLSTLRPYPMAPTDIAPLICQLPSLANSTTAGTSSTNSPLPMSPRSASPGIEAIIKDGQQRDGKPDVGELTEELKDSEDDPQVSLVSV